MITKKVILDVDPGIEDAVAMTLALFEPQWEVVAVTATGGNVLPDQATRNVQAVIEQLDPPRWPRLGVASLPDDGLPGHSTEIMVPTAWGTPVFRSPSCSIATSRKKSSQTRFGPPRKK